MTELDSPTVSEYLVETWLVGINKSKLKVFAIIIRLLQLMPPGCSMDLGKE